MSMHKWWDREREHSSKISQPSPSNPLNSPIQTPPHLVKKKTRSNFSKFLVNFGSKYFCFENFMRIGRRLKEWTITFPLKSWPEKRKRQSCNGRNWFCKRKVPKSPQHTFIHLGQFWQWPWYKFWESIFMGQFFLSFEFRLVFTFHW